MLKLLFESIMCEKIYREFRGSSLTGADWRVKYPKRTGEIEATELAIVQKRRRLAMNSFSLQQAIAVSGPLGTAGEADGASVATVDLVLLPVNIIQSSRTLQCGIIVDRRLFRRNIFFKLSYTMHTSEGIKLLYTKILCMRAVDKYKLLAMVALLHPELKISQSEGNYFIDLAKVPFPTRLAINRYVGWVHNHPVSIATRKTLTRVRCAHILSEVKKIFEFDNLSMALIIARFESREGVISLDKNLKGETFFQLEWFCEKYREEKEDNLRFGRFQSV